jgi:hypothetical protein
MEMHIPALQSFKLLQHFLAKDLLELVTIETAEASIKVWSFSKLVFSTVLVLHYFNAGEKSSSLYCK